MVITVVPAFTGLLHVLEVIYELQENVILTCSSLMPLRLERGPSMETQLRFTVGVGVVQESLILGGELCPRKHFSGEKILYIDSPYENRMCVPQRFCFALKHKCTLGHHTPLTVLMIE